VGFTWVRSPVNDKIGAVLYFAKSAGWFSNGLKCHARWTMTDGRAAVDASAQQFCERDRLALRFTGGAAQSIDKGITYTAQAARSLFDAFLETRRPALDSRHWKVRGLSVIQEPCLAKHTCIFGLDYAISFDNNTDVVAIAAAKCTHHMIKLHNEVPRSPFPVPRWNFCFQRGTENGERLTKIGSNSTSTCLESGMPEA
jgi:hypothetical protein